MSSTQGLLAAAQVSPKRSFNTLRIRRQRHGYGASTNTHELAQTSAVLAELGTSLLQPSTILDSPQKLKINPYDLFLPVPCQGEPW
jgi:hypothetical protein